MFQFYSLFNMKVIWVYYLLLINPYKFIGDCLYFLKNTEHLKTTYRFYIMSCKIFFPIKDNIFQRKHELIANPFMLQ